MGGAGGGPALDVGPAVRWLCPSPLVPNQNPPFAAANSTPPRPPQPQGASKSLDPLSAQTTPTLVTSPAHVPGLLNEGQQRRRQSSSSRTKVQHPSSLPGPGQSWILCTDTAPGSGPLPHSSFFISLSFCPSACLSGSLLIDPFVCSRKTSLQVFVCSQLTHTVPHKLSLITFARIWFVSVQGLGK